MPILETLSWQEADRMWQAYQVADFEGRKQIEQYLRILSLQYLQATPDQPPAMFLPPPAEVLQGDYPVGYVILQEKTFGTFAIREDEWLQHVAILGRSGCTLPAIGALC